MPLESLRRETIRREMFDRNPGRSAFVPCCRTLIEKPAANRRRPHFAATSPERWTQRDCRRLRTFMFDDNVIPIRMEVSVSIKLAELDPVSCWSVSEPPPCRPVPRIVATVASHGVRANLPQATAYDSAGGRVCGAISSDEDPGMLDGSARPHGAVTEHNVRADILSPEDETQVGQGLLCRAHVQWGAQASPPWGKRLRRRGVGGLLRR